MFIYSAIIKEFGNNNILTPSYHTENKTSIEELKQMWGLDEPYIQWYELYEEIEKKRDCVVKYKIDFAY